MINYLVALSEKGVPEIDDVRMLHFSHDLQFPVLVPLILIDFLDGDVLASLYYSCLDNIRI